MADKCHGIIESPRVEEISSHGRYRINDSIVDSSIGSRRGAPGS